MLAPEPSLAGERDPEPGMNGNARALPYREARSEAARHVAASEPSPARRWDPKP
jgi:hypothetical protein